MIGFVEVLLNDWILFDKLVDLVGDDGELIDQSWYDVDKCHHNYEDTQ